MASETALSKSLRVLRIVVLLGTVRVKDVSSQLDMPYSTARRLLGLLEDGGFVRENHGVYSPGPVLSVHGRAVANPSSLVEVMPSVLGRLRDQTKETAICLVRSGDHAVVLAEEQSHHIHRIVHKRGQVMPLYAGAGPRLLLAYAPASTVDAVIERGLSRFTDGTLTERSLLRGLEQIRRTGHAVSQGEIVPHTVAIALPVSVGGQVVCSLAVTGPTPRCDQEWLTRALGSLREAVGLSRELLMR